MDASRYSEAEVREHRSAFRELRRRYQALRWMERAAEGGFIVIALANCGRVVVDPQIPVLLAGLGLAAFLFRLMEKRIWKCPACGADLREAMKTEVCPGCRLLLTDLESARSRPSEAARRPW